MSHVYPAINGWGIFEDAYFPADHGIVGKILFRDDPKAAKPEQIIIQVKGGKTGVKGVRDLRGVLATFFKSESNSALRQRQFRFRPRRFVVQAKNQSHLRVDAGLAHLLNQFARGP